MLRLDVFPKKTVFTLQTSWKFASWYTGYTSLNFLHCSNWRNSPSASSRKKLMINFCHPVPAISCSQWTFWLSLSNDTSFQKNFDKVLHGNFHDVGRCRPASLKLSPQQTRCSQLISSNIHTMRSVAALLQILSEGLWFYRYIKSCAMPI